MKCDVVLTIGRAMNKTGCSTLTKTLDGTTYQEKSRITVLNGPGMTIFSPDGKYGYVCSSLTLLNSLTSSLVVIHSKVSIFYATKQKERQIS